MRPFIIIVIQILVSAFLTASVMPLILVTTPAAAANPRLGLGLMAAVLLVSFTLVALVWPRRKRREARWRPAGASRRRPDFLTPLNRDSTL